MDDGGYYGGGRRGGFGRGGGRGGYQNNQNKRKREDYEEDDRRQLLASLMELGDSKQVMKASCITPRTPFPPPVLRADSPGRSPGSTQACMAPRLGLSR